MTKTPETVRAAALSGHVDEKATPLERAFCDRSEVLVQVDDGAHRSFSVLLLSWAQSRRGERVKFYVLKESAEWRALCAATETASSILVAGRPATMIGFEAEQLSLFVELLVERQGRAEEKEASRDEQMTDPAARYRYVITPVDDPPVEFIGSCVEGTIELPAEPDTSHEKGNSTG